MFAVRGDGNVGIGTSAPAAKLDVNGDAKFNGSILLNAASQFIYSPTGTIILSADNTGGSGGLIDFKTNGIDRMRITAAGNVGIGTTSPASMLHVTGLITIGTATAMLTSAVAMNDGAAAAAGTLLNAPAAGNPTKWIPFNDNGTTRYIPAW